MIGFRAIGDHFTTQIDSNFENLAFNRKVQMVQVAGGGGGRYRYETSDLFSERAVLAFRPEDTDLFRVEWSTSAVPNAQGNRLTATLHFFVPTGTKPPVTVWLYIFDELPPPPSSGYGIIVRDADGNPTYHTGVELLRVVDFVNKNISGDIGSWPHNNPGTRNPHPVPPGVYAIAPTTIATQYISNMAIQEGDYGESHFDIRPGDCGAAFAWVAEETTFSPWPSSIHRRCSYMIIDVEGL